MMPIPLKTIELCNNRVQCLSARYCLCSKVQFWRPNHDEQRNAQTIPPAMQTMELEGFKELRDTKLKNNTLMLYQT